MIAAEHPVQFELELTVNGKPVRRTVATHRRLLDFLRDDLRLTGSKEACGEGECGACTVLMDGITVNSCLIFAVEAHRSEIVTIEGLAEDPRCGELLDAFIEHHSVQCGYCIPGMVLSGEQALRDHEHPSREQIQRRLAGNICRCTGYHKIIDAVESAGAKRS